MKLVVELHDDRLTRRPLSCFVMVLSYSPAAELMGINGATLYKKLKSESHDG